jgi:uncharacterized protein DUF3891
LPAVIVSARAEGLVIVRQVDHQAQCELMAEAWGNAEFLRPDPFDPIRRAGACHDEGWRSWEEAPEVDPAGRPVDFPDIDSVRHTALYRDGIEWAARGDARAGLVVSMHGQGLYERRLGLDGAPKRRSDQPPHVRGFIEEQEAFQAAQRAALGGGEELDRWAWAAYRLLQAWDKLSLYLLWRGLPDARPGSLQSVPHEPGDPGIDLQLTPDGPRAAICDPFPFSADEVALPVAARVIPDRRYGSHDELREALAESPWVTREHWIRRPPARGASGR